MQLQTCRNFAPAPAVYPVLSTSLSLSLYLSLSLSRVAGGLLELNLWLNLALLLMRVWAWPANLLADTARERPSGRQLSKILTF